MEKYTREQLMLYLFEEASPILKQSIDQTLKEDFELQSEIKMLRRSKKQLEKLGKIQVSPSEETINTILQYAKESSNKKRK
jgi:hypothetical protein